MKKICSTALILLAAILLIVNMPTNGLAVDGTMKIKCGAARVYAFESPDNSKGCRLRGELKIQQSGTDAGYKVRLSVTPCAKDSGDAFSAMLTVKYQDGTTAVITRTLQKQQNGSVRLTVVENGKRTESLERAGTAGETLFAGCCYLEATGPSGAALKSITAVLSQTGMASGDLHYTIKS